MSAKSPLLYDLAIIGGGSAGLAASNFAARRAGGHFSIALLEKAPRVGRKLLVTGNGTCNLSNIGAAPVRYHGADSEFVKYALECFTPDDTEKYFTSIGVECIRREDGRIYPLCAHAGAVLDCLRMELTSLGVQEMCDTAVSRITPENSIFRLDTAKGDIYARRVLVSTGGAAYPSIGGSAGAYSLLTDLGHTRLPLIPSIVQLRTDTRFIKAVKGVRVNAIVTFELDGTPLASEKGEVLFTEYGLSGPAVMQISRFAADWERRKRGRMTAVLNLVPDMDEKELMESLQRRAGMSGRTLGDLLTGLFQKRLGQTVMRVAGYGNFTISVNSLQNSDLIKIAAAITRWEIEVIGTQGMGGAQVTSGGVATHEFNPKTFESRIVPGVYAVGEVLDIDGDCGGFNLQWAWASAFTAANSIVESLEND